MSINWKASSEINKMSENELKEYFERFPGSGKKIVAVCEGGHRCQDRIICYQAYRDLCQSCTNKKRYEDPEERKKTGEATKKAHRDDPTIAQRQSKSQIKRRADPKDREKTSIVGKKRYEDPEERKKTGEAVKKAHHDDPTIAQRISEATKKAHRDDPGISQRISESHKKLYRDDPSLAKQKGEAAKKRYAEMDDPGLEMCIHHYIYYFNDLTKYTIIVTRSEHSTIHNNLRRVGLEVPHINIMVND